MRNNLAGLLLGVVGVLWATAFILHFVAGSVPAPIWQAAGGMSLGLLVATPISRSGCDGAVILAVPVLLAFCTAVGGAVGAGAYGASAIAYYLIRRRVR